MRFLQGYVLYVLWGSASLAFLLFSQSSIISSGYLGWHDQQRATQLLLLIPVAVIIFFSRFFYLSSRGFLIVFLFFLLGLFSCLKAASPVWAIKEWGRWLGLVLLMLVVARFELEFSIRRVIVFSMAFVGGVQVFLFLVVYCSAFVSGLNNIDAEVLLVGFSNPRFFGQFQVLLFPVLALLYVDLCARYEKYNYLIFFILALQWCISFMLGGRGLWLGLVLGHAALLIVSIRHRQLFAVQFWAALTGFGIFALMFHLLPCLFGMETVLYDGLRVGLSAREVIWGHAWVMSVENPFLGVGPMHFSAEYNQIAAHPHQMVLQLMAEWGFPAAALACALIFMGLATGIKVLRSDSGSRDDACLWVVFVSALALAQVDGVFVMPYTETWLAILAGIAVARWSSVQTVGRSQYVFFTLSATAVCSIFGYVLLYEVWSLPSVEHAYLETHSTGLSPRFWEQGWISTPFVGDRGMEGNP